jgi:sugar lactone lactonase YvrE
LTQTQKGVRVAALGFLCSALSLGGSTKTWIQSESADFEKGNLHHISIRSDGRLTLAPKSTELFDASAGYLWGLAIDSHGTLYTGGGPGAKLYSVTAAGVHKKVADFEELEVHAIAIDSHDQVFVGTSPDGKVYKIGADGKAAEFYNPKQKYIWSMAFGPHGDLFVATGDQGEVHRVDRNGKGAVFFKTEQTHARSLVFDAKGDLIVGTDPGGLVIRVGADGKGFVLYQMAKREVTALAVAKDGSILAAAGAGSAPPAAAPAAPGAVQIVDPSKAPPTPTPAPSQSGAGTDVYRIHPDGRPEKLWTGARDSVYAIAFDSEGRVLLGAGNKGTLYRIDTPTLYTSLLTVISSQITGLASGPGGALYAATGNVGKIFRIGPGLENEGTIESDVFDSGQFSQWGRLKYDGDTHGGKISVVARTGNLDRPEHNWSTWSAPVTTATGAKPALQPARFLQWKATMTGPADLDAVEVAYLPRNVAPKVEEIDVTPVNYKFPVAATTPFAIPAAPATINLPALTKHQTTATPTPSIDLSGLSMQLAKGWLGARWNASDENGDTLSFTVEIKGTKEKEWKPLADKVREKHVSFDSTAFPDGEYRLRITASDAPSNVNDEALNASGISAPFYIDNTAPEITALRAARESAAVRVHWHAADALNIIKRAEYCIDGGEWKLVDPVGKLSDSLALDYDLTLPATAGEHTVAVRVTDDYDNVAVAKVVEK